MSDFNDKIKVHTAPGSGTQYVHTIDLLYTQEEKNALYEEAMKQAEKEMSEETKYWDALNTIKHVTSWLKENADLYIDLENAWYANYSALNSTIKPLDDLIAEHSKYPLADEIETVAGLHGINVTNRKYWGLAPVSSTLDRLLDGFDGAAEGEADLGEIMHKGEKVMVKIKVVRGEG